jgi:hypothetical protein
MTVYLAITAEGLRDALELAKGLGVAVWCGADSISSEDFDELACANVTRFDYCLIDADEGTIADALSTIQEHHPGERIWVEGRFGSE